MLETTVHRETCACGASIDVRFPTGRRYLEGVQVAHDGAKERLRDWHGAHRGCLAGAPQKPQLDAVRAEQAGELVKPRLWEQRFDAGGTVWRAYLVDGRSCMVHTEVVAGTGFHEGLPDYAFTLGSWARLPVFVPGKGTR